MEKKNTPIDCYVFFLSIVNLAAFPKEKNKENNIYDGTCYFSLVGIDTGDMFARQVCLSKDKQSCLSQAS